MVRRNIRGDVAHPDLFKAALLVTDLSAAMRDLSRWLDLAWTPVQSADLSLRTAAGREDVTLRFAYSTKGPLYLELLEARDAGYYAAPGGSHLHHVGRWVDDLAGTSSRLAARGLPLEAAGMDAQQRAPVGFAFHRGDHGLRVELVDRALKPGFEEWLAGGRLVLG